MKEVANNALPPKAKITRLVWIGRMRPKLVQGRSRLSAGQTNWAAMNTQAHAEDAPDQGHQGELADDVG